MSDHQPNCPMLILGVFSLWYKRDGFVIFVSLKKELALKEMELQEQARQAQASTSPAATPTPRNKDAKSLNLPSFIDEKDELDSYLLCLNAKLRMLFWRKTHG